MTEKTYDPGYNCGWCGKKIPATTYTRIGNQPYRLFPDDRKHPYYKNKWFCCEKCKSEFKKAHGCFITTATCQSRNLPDNCHELTSLRHFRDTYMKNNEEMESEIQEYYEIAPIICQNIDKKQNSSEIYENIYEKWLKSAVLAVDEGKNEEAHDIYKDMVISLKSEYYR